MSKTPSIGPLEWVRSFPRAVRDLVERRTRCAPELVGTTLHMSDGRTFVPFRHTRKHEADWSWSYHPAVLQPRFHLGVLTPERQWLHALFRVVCIVTTPFFAGIRGFRSKLWMVDPETGDFAGLYEWDDAATAKAYAEGLAKVLRLLSTRGSVTYELVENCTVEEYLDVGHCAHAVRTSDSGDLVAAGGR
jgi:hypothetical protein